MNHWGGGGGGGGGGNDPWTPGKKSLYFLRSVCVRARAHALFFEATLSWI